MVESLKMVGFQHPQSPLPRREETKLAGNPKHGWVNEGIRFSFEKYGYQKNLENWWLDKPYPIEANAYNK